MKDRDPSLPFLTFQQPMNTQTHIHMSDTLEGSGELAPDWKWKVKEDGWNPRPSVIASVERGLKGNLLISQITDSNGDPKQFTDYEYIIRVDDYWGQTKAERWTKLLELLGKTVYLVDVLHEDDGTDHSPSVRQMYFSEIGDITPVNTGLEVIYATIRLQDDTI